MSTAKEPEPSRSKWPDGVEPLSWVNSARIGVGRDGRLYWDGRQVETRTRLGLTFWQKLGAVIVVLGALGAIGQGIDATHNFGCKVHFWTQGCPKP